MPDANKPADLYDAVQNPQPQAVIVYCSDPRFQNAFDQFIEKNLGLAKGQFIPLVIGGGAGVLANPLKLPKEFKFMKDRLELFREHFPSIKRVVLINHEDCAYYKSIREKIAGFLGSQVKTASPKEDLAVVAAVFKSLLTHLGVELDLYYAGFADETHGKIRFEQIKI